MGKCKKLAARYCRPFEIPIRVGLIAYELALPSNIRAHNFFHVSLLKKYIHDPDHIVDWHVIKVEPKGDFQVQPVCIFEKNVTML